MRLNSLIYSAISIIVVVIVSSCSIKAPQDRGHAVRTYSQEVFDLSSSADQAYRESHWIDAVRHYTKLTEIVPADAYIWFRLGNTYAQQGFYNQAIHAYEASIERDPSQPKPWFNLSTAYLLHAQAAMNNSWQQLRADDPARIDIEIRLSKLHDLIHQRIEDSETLIKVR